MKPNPRRFLVTAGSTREMVDRVRVWSNIFTGQTGLAIARALAEVGPVDLLTSNAAHVSELSGGQSSAHPVSASLVNTHAELKGALAALLARQKYDAVFMTAAVADYRPVGVWAVIGREPDSAGQESGVTDPGSKSLRRERWLVESADAPKVKSTHERIAVLAERTDKLVDLFRNSWGYKGLLVKFKLEVGLTPAELIRVGQESRQASGAEYLVANTLDMTAGENAGAYLLSDAGEEWVPRDQLAARMVRLVNPPSP